MFSAISDSAAASSRRSISIATERRSVSTTSIRRSRRASAEMRFGVARGEGEGVEVDAGSAARRRAAAPSPRPARGRPRVATSARCTCAIEAAATGGPNAANASRSGLPSAAATARLRLGLRERRHLVLQRFEIARERDADHVRPRRQELAELHIGRPEPGQRGREPVGGARARRPLDQPREPQRQRAPAAAAASGSTSANTPSRANTKPARARRARWTRRSDHRAGDHSRQPECSATMPPRHALERDAARSRPSRIISANASGRGKRRIDSTR